MLKSVSELIRGGNEGSHPPEPIGTTSRAPRTRASKVNELRMRGEEEAEERQKAEDAALAPRSVPQLEPPSVSGSTSTKSNFQWSHHLTARRCFDSTPRHIRASSSSSPSSLARSIPYTDLSTPSTPDEQADGRTDASRTRCAGLPDTGRQRGGWCW